MGIAKIIIVSGSVLTFLAVLIGAFGAHAFADLLEKNQRLDVFETASRYHFYHALALLILGVLYQINDGLVFKKATFLCFLAGVLTFSGSLYCLAVLNASWLGAIAPIGGTLLLGGWGLLIYSILIELKSDTNSEYQPREAVQKACSQNNRIERN